MGSGPLTGDFNDDGFLVGIDQQSRGQPAIGAAMVLGRSGIAVPLTGTLTETTLASLTLPGGIMGRHGWLRITSLWTFTNSANNKVMRCRLAGQALGGYTATSNAMLRMSNIMANKGVENAQVLPTGNVAFFDGITTGSVGAFAIDTEQDQTLTFTAQLANVGESITLEMWMVEVMPSP